MRFVNRAAALCGYVTVTLFVLGAIGLGDFRMYFGPVGSINCTRETP